MYSFFEQVFSGINSLGNQGFTNIFLLIQFFLFLAMAGFQMFRIQKEINIMNRIKPQLMELHRSNDSDTDKRLNDIFGSFGHSKYKDLWERYYNRVSQKNEDERINVEPFFGFEVMHYHMGYRKLMDIGSGIHVSIGVLGTFIGLAVGLAGLHLGDTDALRSGIGSLLDGMKVAFYTSVWGVLLSLFWTVFDQMISSILDRNIDLHSERLDYLLSTDDQELLLNRLEKVSRNQADHLKTLLTDALEKAMQPMVTTIQQSQGSVQFAFGQLTEQFSKLQEGVERQALLLENQVELTRTTSSDMTTRLVDQITGGTQESLSQFSSLVIETQTMQRTMMDTIHKVIDNFSNAEQRQASTAAHTERIYEQFGQMVTEMEQMRSSYKEAASFMEGMGASFQHIQQLTEQQLPVQQEVMRSNQSLAQKYDSLTENFSQFNQHIENKYEELLQQVMTVSTSLTSSFKELTDSFSAALNTQQRTLADSDSLLRNVQGVVSHLTPLAPELREVVGNIHYLKEQLQTMQELQHSLLPELVQLRKQTNETVQNALQTTQSYMDNMTTQLGDMRDHWTTTKEQFSSTTEALHVSVKDFSENIDNGLSKTYHHFDETLTKAVREVSNLVYQFKDSQSEFIDTFEEIIEELERIKNSGHPKAGASS